ncbi:hypothetical protein CLHUN_34080 [Ruminiclostridium hungatei]|uniref:DUF3899 domain-containing protein n=1 Tax=Ruminiclostridium hungatei TaxID=48256 RepID=A0A1V4SGZ0_RUMHU|nr:hypothetical protein [Ruminiclostridium hungatei]OPX42756.1 hypothetical protein CLHUN_34080 [Ruminiclostridium hungatei]
MDFLEILSLIIMAVGFVVVYSAKPVVKRFGLQEKQNCANASEMTEKEVQAYKMNKAVFNIKVKGLLISIPGLVLFILSFKR